MLPAGAGRVNEVHAKEVAAVSWVPPIACQSVSANRIARFDEQTVAPSWQASATSLA